MNLRLGAAVLDLVLWILTGAALGILRARYKMRGIIARSKQIVAEMPPGPERGHIRGYNAGLRLSAYAIFGGIGAVLGAAIWGIATLVTRIL